MTEYRICTLPGAWDGEWCRVYCLNYGAGLCRYDENSGKMMVKIDRSKKGGE